ncbi:MAG: hypothetical protein WCD35_16340 [Mycobacteriales bacterium]
MKARYVTAAALVAALVAGTSGAQAAYPVLDGKRVKVLTLTASGGVQDNDKEMASLSPSDRVSCTAPRCSRLTFTYLPAKGVRNRDLMFSVTWTNPASDIDLYVAEVARNGDSSEVGHCAGAGQPSEKVFVKASALKPGKTYALIVDWFRSINETAHAKVEIGVPSSIKTTVPAAVESQTQNVNCTL